MKLQNTTSVIRLKSRTASNVALFASALNMTPAQIVELAVERWLAMTPKEALGFDPQDLTKR